MPADSTDRRQTLTTTVAVVACVLGLLSVAVFLPLLAGAPNATPSDAGADDGTTGEPTTQTPTTRQTDRQTTTEEDDETGGSGGVGLVRRNDPVRVVVDGNPIPGTTVTVRVLKGAAPVGGVTVYVNDDPIGRTNKFGRLEVRVPEEESFRVSARRPENRTHRANPGSATVAPSVAAPQPTVSAPMPSGGLATDRMYSIARPTRALRQTAEPDSEENGTVSTTVETRSDAAITFQRDPRLGERVSLTVRVDGTPIPNATVRVNGEHVGRTGPYGRATVRMPVAANVTVTAERGPISATRTVTFDGLDVSVEPRILPMLVAGQDAVVTITQSGAPAPGVPVRLDGKRVGETNDWGQLTTGLPFEGNATVVATSGPFSTTQRVDGLFDPFVDVGYALGSLVLAGVVIRWRYGSILGVARWLIRGGRSSLVVVLVTLATNASVLVDWLTVLAKRLVEFLERLRDADTAELRVILRNALHTVRAKAATLAAALRARGRSVIARLRSRFRRSTANARPSNGTANTKTESGRPADYVTIREAWKTAIGPLSPSEFRSKTPAEIAVTLVERGDPPAETQTIVEAFRDVEYGDRNPDDYVEAVEQAAVALERARSETDSDPVSATTGGAES